MPGKVSCLKYFYCVALKFALFRISGDSLFCKSYKRYIEAGFYLNQQGIKNIGKTTTKKFQYICDNSSDSFSSEEDSTTPSPSKYAEVNAPSSDLPSKSKEILNTISACKKFVRHTKIVSIMTNTTKLFFLYKIFHLENFKQRQNLMILH